MVILKATSLFDEYLMDIYITCRITRDNVQHMKKKKKKNHFSYKLRRMIFLVSGKEVGKNDHQIAPIRFQ